MLIYYNKYSYLRVAEIIKITHTGEKNTSVPLIEELLLFRYGT